MVVLWGPQCNPMSPIYIKMSKFPKVLFQNLPNVLFERFQITNKSRKLNHHPYGLAPSRHLPEVSVSAQAFSVRVT